MKRQPTVKIDPSETKFHTKVIRFIQDQIFRNRKVQPKSDIDSEDEDIDCDALENKMMRSLEKER